MAAVVVTIIYSTIFNSMFGSPKGKSIKQEIENLKLKYSLMGRNIDNSMKIP